MIVRGAINPLQIFVINKKITQSVSTNLRCVNKYSNPLKPDNVSIKWKSLEKKRIKPYYS